MVVAWRTGIIVELTEQDASATSSSSKSKTAKSAYRAMVRQLDKPEYKIEVLVRVPDSQGEDGTIREKASTSSGQSGKGKQKRDKETKKRAKADRPEASGEAVAQKKLISSIFMVP